MVMLSVMLVALIGSNILVFDDEVGRKKKTKRTYDPMDSTSVNAMEEKLLDLSTRIFGNIVAC